MSYCHCDDCRRATAAPVTIFVGFAESSLTFADGARPVAHQATPSVSRLFCPDCGTPVAYQDRRLSNRLYFYIGVMRTPDRYMPTCHAFVAEKLAWLSIDDGLPRYDAFSQPR